MTRNDPADRNRHSQEPREDEQDSPLELDDETLSDLTTDEDAEDVRGGGVRESDRGCTPR